MSATVSAESSPATDKRQFRRVALSSYLGSTIEFYDFILYATASSLVFGPVFFAGMDPLLATFASYLTFATGYLARPLGGVIFGHFGDRVGRKKMLVISMTVMGSASVLIGLVPAIPIWGAVALLVLRAVQGIAIGGEWGGAALMSMEHAGPKNRGLAASFANAGGPAGAFLGTAALALFALLPEEDFLSWGWRIPFLFSVVLLILGLYIRAKIQESPVFEAAQEMEAKKADKKRAVPVLEVLKRPRILLVVGVAGMAAFVIQALFSTFAITYAAGNGITRSEGLWAFAICQLLATASIPAFAALSDRVGRRPVMLTGLVLGGAAIYPVFGMLGSGSFGLVVLAFIIQLTVCQAMAFGPMAAFLGENFGTTSRYTGASLGYQLASLLGAGFTPVIVSGMYAAQGGSITGVIWYAIIMCAVSALVLIFLTKESRSNNINTLDTVTDVISR